MSGAEKGCGLPLDVFADLHKKKKMVFTSGNHLFSYTKTESEHVRILFCGSPSDFFRFLIFIYFPGHNMR